MKRSLAAAVGCLALASSASADGAGRFDAAMRQCEQDVGPRWLEPPPRLERLLLLGSVEDPATTGGPLVSRNGLRYLGGSLETWMTHTGLRRVDLYIQPGIEAGADQLLGPRRGEPDGIYAFERLAAGDPRCAAYDLTTAARAAARPPQPPLIPGSDCVAYRYVGPLTLEPYSYIVLDYGDRAAARAGYSRFVEELRRGVDHPVARAVAYRFPGQPATCAAETSYLTDLLQRDASR